MDFLFEAFSFDWKTAVIDFLRVALAFGLAVPIGWERHRSERNLGLRTFPLVAISACGFMLILKNADGANSPETNARLIAGLITGIGFIGCGAILKEGTNVRGLATASSVWTTGAIGAAVAFGRAEIAVVLSAITFLTLRILTPIVETDGYDGNAEQTDKSKSSSSENQIK